MESQCSICLEVITEADTATCTECNHEFHIRCLSLWLRESPKCPACRANILPERHVMVTEEHFTSIVVGAGSFAHADNSIVIGNDINLIDSNTIVIGSEGQRVQIGGEDILTSIRELEIENDSILHVLSRRIEQMEQITHMLSLRIERLNEMVDYLQGRLLITTAIATVTTLGMIKFLFTN